jgi:hypothetical protein
MTINPKPSEISHEVNGPGVGRTPGGPGPAPDGLRVLRIDRRRVVAMQETCHRALGVLAGTFPSRAERYRMRSARCARRSDWIKPLRLTPGKASDSLPPFVCGIRLGPICRRLSVLPTPAELVFDRQPHFVFEPGVVHFARFAFAKRYPGCPHDCTYAKDCGKYAND